MERLLDYRLPKPKETLDVNLGGPSDEQVGFVAALQLTPHERRLRLVKEPPAAIPAKTGDPGDNDE
jgi:hypothetical protein